MSYSVNDVFKNEFIKIESFESKFTKFYEELLVISDKFELGKDISFDVVYDGPSPEMVFTINIHYNLNFDDEYYFSGKIIEHMGDFSRKENMFDFFKEAYVLISSA